MIIFGLNSEVWKLESKLEMFRKQFEIKNAEMEKVNDKVGVEPLISISSLRFYKYELRMRLMRKMRLISCVCQK